MTSKFDPTTTLTEATNWLADRFDAGATCPCCGQFVKRYKRKLNSSMAVVMILLYRWDRRDQHDDCSGFRAAPPYVHVPSYLAWCTRNNANLSAAIRGDWAKLKHWDLIAEMPNQKRDDGSKRAGFYQITDLGRAFVQGRYVVPAHIYLYNEEVQEMESQEAAATPRVTIQQALKQKFNYDELMGT